jgi:large subunit ribosomal protein L28
MARRCFVTRKGVQTGNNVSHANNKTRRRFLPNLQKTTVVSESLGRLIRLRVSAHGLRAIEHMGGIDAYVLRTKAGDLPSDLRRLKRHVERAKLAVAAPQEAGPQE